MIKQRSLQLLNLPAKDDCIFLTREFPANILLYNKYKLCLLHLAIALARRIVFVSPYTYEYFNWCLSRVYTIVKGITRHPDWCSYETLSNIVINIHIHQWIYSYKIAHICQLYSLQQLHAGRKHLNVLLASGLWSPSYCTCRNSQYRLDIAHIFVWTYLSQKVYWYIVFIAFWFPLGINIWCASPLCSNRSRVTVIIYEYCYKSKILTF